RDRRHRLAPPTAHHGGAADAGEGARRRPDGRRPARRPPPRRHHAAGDLPGRRHHRPAPTLTHPPTRPPSHRSFAKTAASARAAATVLAKLRAGSTASGECCERGVLRAGSTASGAPLRVPRVGASFGIHSRYEPTTGTGASGLRP